VHYSKISNLMTISGQQAALRWVDAMSAYPSNVLQNYFSPWRVEYFSKSRLEPGILIQETVVADSDRSLAEFCNTFPSRADIRPLRATTTCRAVATRRTIAGA
jgi:hypothetical protein